ncbi:flavoprotein [Streptomyces sp. NPDC051132]|uniref:flavoprotein n=1 Tax=unclassified Streptomyces TaxID=2593676 RepID=UPI003432DF53
MPDRPEDDIRTDSDAGATADIGTKRLLFVVTGSINAALVPFWMHWLRQSFPLITSDILVTRSAQRFVTKEALCRLVEGRVWTDDFDEPDLPQSAHVEIEEKADGFAVFPSTLDFAMRLAAGDCGSPATMALQITEKPIVLATAFPGSNPVIETHMARLLSRPNLALSDTVSAYSVGKKKWDRQTGFHLPLVLQKFADLFPRGDTRATPHA